MQNGLSVIDPSDFILPAVQSMLYAALLDKLRLVCYYDFYSVLLYILYGDSH